MNLASLSFSALPAISVPFRYFVSAVVFMILTSVLILFFGESPWLSRWQPQMLAITHLFTLGFISMVMMGAIYQFLPVVGGVGIPNTSKVATISHALHTFGTLALALHFLIPNQFLQVTAMLALGVGFTYYIFSVARVLTQKLSQGNTIIGIRLAVLALVVVVLLGLLLLMQTSSYVGREFSFIANKNYTDIHALIGGIGWAGILIFAVSLQIIPMFHVTPNFPKLLAKYMSVLLAVLLFSLFLFLPSSLAGSFIIACLLVLVSSFNLVVLKLLTQRKRKVSDTSVQLWQFAAASFLVLTILYLIPESIIDSVFLGKKSLLLGAIFIYLYLLSIIEAMLLKITPFLTYTHLQNLCMSNFSAMAHLPHMHELLLKKHGRWLFYSHLLSSIALIITIAYSSLYWLFGMAMLIEFSGLLALILRSLYLFKQCKNKIIVDNVA